MPSIKAHPWVLKPLPEKYAVALKELQGYQAVVDEKIKKGAYVNPDRDKILEVREWPDPASQQANIRRTWL